MKNKRKILKKKLDAIVSSYIRLRDKKCVICGSSERLTNGHLFSRTNLATRWDIREDGNCHCQCLSCNYRHEFDFYPFQNWYINKFGKRKFDNLYKKYNSVSKLTEDDLSKIYDHVKFKLEDLKDKLNIKQTADEL